MILAKVNSLANQGARKIRTVPGPSKRSFFEVLHRLEPRTIRSESTRVYGQITGRHTRNQNLRRLRHRQRHRRRKKTQIKRRKQFRRQESRRKVVSK